MGVLTHFIDEVRGSLIDDSIVRSHMLTAIRNPNNYKKYSNVLPGKSLKLLESFFHLGKNYKY